jgi:uncharacterized protein (DUF1697 family)
MARIRLAMDGIVDQMTIHIGLLRAVNVAGRNKVGMADLRECLVGLGMRDVRSLLQSGNVVFRSDIAVTARVERVLEEAAAQQLGLTTDFLVRTSKDWRALVADNPFREEARRDPSHLLVMCLKSTPEPEKVSALRKAIKGRETIRSKGRQVYIVYPDGIGRSPLTTKLIETALGTRGTGRNWNTVLQLDAMANDS